MTDQKTWMIGQVCDYFFTFECGTGNFYDPHDLRRMTARFNKGRFTEFEAKRLVDKMNKKGPAIEVSDQKKGLDIRSPR